MRITSIFSSIDGEVNGTGGSGMLTTFIRFGGCNLRCCDCDTTYSFKQFKEMSLDEVLKEVEKINVSHRVTITGGEPMMQLYDLNRLTSELILLDYQVSLETNGSYPLNLLQPIPNSIVMDWKTPTSKMCDKMLDENLEKLDFNDWLKIVLFNKEDYDYAKELLRRLPEDYKFRVAFGTAWNKLEPKEVIKWMTEDKLEKVKLQLQLHKVIWPDLINVGPGNEV